MRRLPLRPRPVAISRHSRGPEPSSVDQPLGRPGGSAMLEDPAHGSA
jgi:hypothetical protein